MKLIIGIVGAGDGVGVFVVIDVGIGKLVNASIGVRVGVGVGTIGSVGAVVLAGGVTAGVTPDSAVESVVPRPNPGIRNISTPITLRINTESMITTSPVIQAVMVSWACLIRSGLLPEV